MPESVIELPSSVPLATLLLTAVQSAKSVPAAPAGATASATAIPKASTPAPAAGTRAAANLVNRRPDLTAPPFFRSAPATSSDHH